MILKESNNEKKTLHFSFVLKKISSFESFTSDFLLFFFISIHSITNSYVELKVLTLREQSECERQSISNT